MRVSLYTTYVRNKAGEYRAVLSGEPLRDGEEGGVEVRNGASFDEVDAVVSAEIERARFRQLIDKVDKEMRSR
jgi:hypothetical protein